MGVIMEEIVKDMCKYILNNLYNDINMEILEKKFYYNKYYLIRIFKLYTGFTIKEFINTVKILKSINPLVYTNDTILKIALTNGFNSQEYYSEKFQNVIGISPLKFRKEFQEIDSINDISELKSKKQYLSYLQEYQSNLENIYNKQNKNNKVKKLV